MTIAVTDHRCLRVNWECIQRRARIGGAIVFAFALGGWMNSIRVQEAKLPYLKQAAAQNEQIHRVAGPNPLATIKCERHRANVAEAVADQSVAVSNYTAVPGEILSVIPNCPPPPIITAKAH